MPQWGMTVDLDRCTGCEACVVACHAENNLPIVGDEQAARGRTHALDSRRALLGGRISRTSGLQFLPVMCQQCDAAPCEPVCPTYASHHTRRGPERAGLQPLHRHALLRERLPLQRRASSTSSTPSGRSRCNVQLNPDVSVRRVGVMEKCTFCVQRIQSRAGHGQGREARRAGRRDPAGLRAVVPGEGDRVRRPERSRERRVAAVAFAPRVSSCSKSSAPGRTSPILKEGDA